MIRALRYNAYSNYLLKKYGEKVHKLPINLPGTCPNRDGTLGWGGCIFCDEQGSGFECLPSTYPVKLQIEEAKNFFGRRFSVKKFIVYFQSFTNTYLPLEDFQKNILAAAEEEDVVGVSISTRPDCVSDAHLDFLAGFMAERKLDIDLELGLQTVNYHSLAKVNRGHTLAEFIDAVLRIKRYGLKTCVHLILNLPWDDVLDAVENAKVLSALGVDYVKLHSLYIVRGTVLGDMYERGEITVCTSDEYVERVGLFLEHLDPSVVVQRLAGKGPRDKVLFCNWGMSWWSLRQKIEDHLIKNDIWQGKKFSYLNGSALAHFRECKAL